MYDNYREMFKIFKLKGDPYIFVINNTLFAYDEGFGSIGYIKLSPIDMLPVGSFIACRYKELEKEDPYVKDIHMYNILANINNSYFNDGDGFFLLNDNMADIVYSMKSADNAIINTFHLEEDINKEYLISLTYGMFPVSKGDTVDNYVRIWRSGNELLMKSIVHKKKQKIDLTILHKFLLI